MRAGDETAGARRSRRPSRIVRLTLTFLAGAGIVGLAATVYALLRADPTLRYPTPAALAAGLPVVVATIANLLLRFVRWQYVLRRLEVRVPTIPSLGAFVGSFAFLPVPLYLGQVVARGRLTPGVPARQRAHLVVAFAWERLLDVWALAVLATPALSPPWGLAVVALAAAGLLPAARRAIPRLLVPGARHVARLFSDDEVVVDEAVVRRAASVPVVGVGAFLSLAAWALPAFALVPVAWGAGLRLDPLAGAGAAAYAILLGALSLVPLGAGVAGLLLLRRLHALGAAAVAAAQVVFVFRVATVWFTVAVGALALAALRRKLRQPTAHDHFDAIDECYDAWLPLHYRRHLVTKKTAPMRARLPRGAFGLDIGCGRGWYAEDLRAAGMRMVGVDVSARQLAAAREHLGPEVPLAQASVLGLPFRAHTFDFAYIINVLHHLPTPAHQQLALGEIAHVVRPGGLVFVHEMSVRNPLFRFYLSYVFPIVKGIEEGTEYYLDPQRMDGLAGLGLAAVEFFTFVPDFVPPALLPVLAGIERRLEAGPLAKYGAHFLAVYERTAAA